MTSAHGCENDSKQQKPNILGKRKKVRERRCDFLQNWIDKTTQHTLGCASEADVFEMYGNQANLLQNVYGPRLFNAASDPSVFRYSNPFHYPNEPVSLPMYPPPYVPMPPILNGPDYGFHNATKQIRAPNIYNNNPKRLNRSRKNRVGRKAARGAIDNHFEKFIIQETEASNGNCGDGAQFMNRSNNDFASLPPVVNHIDENIVNSNDAVESDKTDNKRRFSDPGLAQNQLSDGVQEESGEESDSDLSYPQFDGQNSNRLIMCLLDHINLLKDCNKKMHKELHDTKGELEGLRQQLSIWRGDSVSSAGQSGILGGQASGPVGSTTVYAPGMLTDLVREIRDAARVREEALYSKVRTIIEDKALNKNHNQAASIDKARYGDRLAKLEDDLHNLRLNQSRDSVSPCSFATIATNNASPSDQERMRLHVELNKERAARTAADTRVNKLEMMVTQLRSKRGNGSYTPMSTPVHTNGGSTPDHHRHMVMGPITDL